MNNTTINIAIIGGYGRMGNNLINTIQKYHHVHLTCTIVKKKKEKSKIKDKTIIITENIEKYINEFDVLIDFSNPISTLNHLKLCKIYKKNIVIGTTGFSNNEINQIKQYAKYIGIVMSSNFSIGINVLLQLLQVASKTLNNSYDIEIIESHHRNKLDSPSGTALQISKTIAEAKKWNIEKCNIYRKKEISKIREKNKIGLSIVRGGDTVGEHEVIFFGKGEKISIKHQANNRSTFSEGAIQSAIWLKNKKCGLFNMLDVLQI